MTRRSLILGTVVTLVACRPASPATELDSGSTGAATDASAVVPGPPPRAIAPPARIEKVIFSPRGKLAFVLGGPLEDLHSFYVVDARAGTVRLYQGALEYKTVRGWDNRCDVSERGYMANVDIHYVPTNAAENVFVRKDGSSSYREDFAKGESLLLSDSALDVGESHASVVGLNRRYVSNGSRSFVFLNGDGHLVDSKDPAPRTAFVQSSAADAQIKIDDLEGKRWKLPVTVEDTWMPPEPWLSFEQKVLVTPLGALEKAALCVLELEDASRSKCFPFHQDSTFFHLLVSDDAKLIAYNETITGKLPTSPATERDPAADRCFIHVIDRAAAKDTKWRVDCGVTKERPLRFEGNLLVTDASRIANCGPYVIKKYDIATGASKSTARGMTEDDIDPATATAMKRLPPGTIDYLKKQDAWASVHGAELMTWSEGKDVLARKGDDIVVCAKRGGACRPAVASVPGGRDVAGGASRDGTMLAGVFTQGAMRKLVAIDTKDESAAPRFVNLGPVPPEVSEPGLDAGKPRYKK